ncbi:MAG TPA: hypothetical protein VEF03_09565, partial [Candidatus Binataceae bacterium]|nr:hypothetical protein [Candidatus Binataceae bacterium]
FPDCLVCRELLAQNLERNNDLTRAEREYRELVRLEPDRKLYRFYLALIQQRLSKSRTSK